MLTDLVQVGKRYYTKANDLVELVERLHIDLPDGHTHHYNARVLRVVQGHEALMGKVMRYDASGHWLAFETGARVDRCIHDLKEEACDDAIT